MQMDIHAQPFELTRALEQHVTQRVEQAIGTASRSFRVIMVRLLDVNGERRGVDMACRIVAWLRLDRTVMVEAVDRDLYAAIDAASLKLRVALRRRLSRRRTLRCERPNRPVRAYLQVGRRVSMPLWLNWPVFKPPFKREWKP